MAERPDIEALGLLDGLVGPARKDRGELIDWLLDQGFDVEHIRESVSAPLMLPAFRVLGDDGSKVSTRELCAMTGIGLDLMPQMLRAIGLPRVDDPDAVVLPRADAETVRHAKLFFDLGYAPDDAVAVMRGVVHSLGRAAAMIREAAFKTLVHPGASEIELAIAAARMAELAVPGFGPMMDDLLRLELRHAAENEAVTAAERATGAASGARPISVAFADLVGFTRLGEAIPAEELQSIASRLSDIAYDGAVWPVRFVKSIGDAAMLVSPDTGRLLAAMLDLIDDAAADGLPQLRIGVASGRAVTRAGDWFGSPVNLASRMTAVARPGTVIADWSTRRAVEGLDEFDLLPVGVRRFKGVRAGVGLFRVGRRAL